MNIKFHLDKVFRETEDVVFYDISISNSNASDLVIHKTSATSPPDDRNGNKQFYVHYHQVDNNRVISGERTFELVNFELPILDNALLGIFEIVLLLPSIVLFVKIDVD